MISFKKWFCLENLQGPGGGPEQKPENQEKLANNHSQLGVGAFPHFEINTKKSNTPTSKYADRRFIKKFMSADGFYKSKKK